VSSAAGSLALAARALRLNRSFPDTDRYVTHLLLAFEHDPTPSPDTGLPGPRAWSRVRAEAATAVERLASLEQRSERSLPDDLAAQLRQRREQLQRLRDAELLEARQVRVQLRHRDGDRASYLVTVDRQDLATGLVARYTLVLSDTPGDRIPEGELALRASEAFADRLELLGTQDAALAFAALSSEGLDVHEVVRGSIGPAVVGDAGPRGLPLRAPALSALLERASRDLDSVRVADPVPDAVTLPRPGAGFGLVAARKWAVARDEVGPMNDWLRQRGLRPLVYGYG
jgi:hypothetical protein